MSNQNNIVDSALSKLEARLRQEDGAVVESPAPTATPRAGLSKFRRMAIRSGMIEGKLCFIEETKNHVFVLWGFRTGAWRLTAKKRQFDGELDATPSIDEVLVVELRPRDPSTTESELGGVSHEMFGVDGPLDADEFFSERLGLEWHAEQIVDPGEGPRELEEVENANKEE